MSASQLKLQVKTTGEAFFWLGPLGDSTFTAVTTTDGVGTLIYWPANTNSANFNLPRRVVRYYPNLTTYAADHHPLNLPEDLRETRYTNGQMEYGIKNMDYQTFIYSDGSGIVEIHYAEAQTATVLEGNAELVSRVS
jgi:hypothetical protein